MAGEKVPQGENQCLCGVEAEVERPKRDAGRESSPFSPEALLMFYLSGVAKQAVFNSNNCNRSRNHSFFS